jgi:hypothetical protein
VFTISVGFPQNVMKNGFELKGIHLKTAGPTLEGTLRVWIACCMSQFRDDDSRRTTLLGYAVFRRLLERVSVLQQTMWTKRKASKR